MSYEGLAEGQIDVETDDENLINTRVPYSIKAQFKDWPKGTYPDAPGLEE